MCLFCMLNRGEELAPLMYILQVDFYISVQQNESLYILYVTDNLML